MSGRREQIAVVSEGHGNLRALEAVPDGVDERGVDHQAAPA